jgi:TPR repeat protein
VRAAADAFEIAQFCATTGLSRSALLSLPAAASPDVRESLQSSAEGDARNCRDATPAQLGERYADIRIAAEGGVPGAAEKLLDLGLPGELAGDAAIDPAVNDWTEHALELVRRDATTGDVGALTALASVYREGSGVATDPARALSYQLAAVEILKAQPQQYSPYEVALQQEFASRAAASAGRDELDAARQAAVELLAHCCSGLKH